MVVYGERSESCQICKMANYITDLAFEKFLGFVGNMNKICRCVCNVGIDMYCDVANLEIQLNNSSMDKLDRNVCF